MGEILKPCPFCGGTNSRVAVSTYWAGMSSAVISARVMHWCARADGQPQSTIQIAGKSEDEAVAAWNRHATDHAARVAELEAELNGERFKHEITRKALAEATETWSDGHECWRPATAWAYAQACRALAKHRDRAERAEAEAARLREAYVAVVKVESADEYGPCLLWNKGWENYVGKTLYAKAEE